MTKVAKNQRIIKVRLFTWFRNQESPAVPGEQVRMEMINHMGDDVVIDDEQSLARGEELDAFYSDEEADQIRNGTYAGPDAAILEHVSGTKQLPAGNAEVTDMDGEGPQTENLSSQELGEYINENKLNVDQTVALATEGDADSINKVYDAEDHAAQLRGNDSRKGVTDRLDVMLAAATGSDD
jgi:hypothetical protein